MAKETTIRGFTVKIGADTSDFIKGLKKIDKEIQYSEKYAQELQKQLELKWDDAKWSKAQKIVQDDLRDTEAKAKAIREQIEYLNKSGADVNSESFKKLNVELEKTTTQTLKLQQSLEQINKLKLDRPINEIKKLSDNLGNAAKKTAILSATAAGAIAGIYKLGTSTASAGAKLQDYSDRLGVSAEELQRWQYIAMQSGLETEQLTKSMSKTRDAIGTALTGGSNAATNALQTLLGDLSKLPQDTSQGFQVIINALAGVKDSTLQAYYANEIFGEKLATDLIPLINQGAGTIAKFNNEFEQIGYLSNEQVQSLADFDDQMNIVNSRLALAKNELGIALLPLVEEITNLLTNVVIPVIKDIANWFDNLDESQRKLIITALLLVASLSPVLKLLSGFVGIIPKIIGMLNVLSLHPIIAIIGAVIGLMTYLYATNEEFRESIDKLLGVLSRALGSVLKPIMKVISTIFDLLSPIIDLIVNILVPALDLVSMFLEPIVWLLEKISDLVNRAGDFILGIFGKGWLWGKDTDNSSTSATSNANNSRLGDFTIPKNSNFSYDNSVYDNSFSSNDNINIVINSNQDAKEIADQVIKQIQVAKQSSGR